MDKKLNEKKIKEIEELFKSRVKGDLIIEAVEKLRKK